MERIDKLTDEQKARFGEWRDKWISIGLSTERADFDRFEKAAKKCYKFAGLTPNVPVVRVSSPIVGAFASAIAKEILKDKKYSNVHSAVNGAVHSAVNSAVNGSFDSSVHSAVHSAVYSAVYSSVHSAVRSSFDSSVHSAVDDSVHSAVRSAFDSAVNSSIHRAFDSAVNSAVYSAVYSAVRSAVHGAVRSAFDSAFDSAVNGSVISWHSWIGGQMWPWWQSYVTFFTDVCDWAPSGDILERINAYRETSESACYWWPNKNFIMVSDRPTKIEMDSQGRLHSESDMAIKWPDGWGLWMWHGTIITEQIILHPETITKEQILAEKNSEVSRAIAERIGWKRYLELIEVKLIDKWFDSDKVLHYELYDFKNRQFGLAPRFLKMESPELNDGTRPYYIEPVDPNLKNCQAARKWQFWDDEKGRYPTVEECNQNPSLAFQWEA